MKTGKTGDIRPAFAGVNGVVLALIAFAGFPIGDAIVKSAAGLWPAPAMAGLRFAIGAIGLATILWMREGRAGFSVGRPWLHAARGLALAVGTMTFFSAIFVMPLADAVAISFVNPIITALFSGWFLGERMRPAVWVATLIAFAGVLIMLRPNFANFGWVAVLPLISAVAMSTMIILNRMVSQQRSIWAAQFYIAFWAAVFLTMASLIGHFSLPSMQIETWPGWPLLWRCIVVACTATFFHIILYMATMRSSAAAIAPAVYIQMLVSGVISVVIFDDPMDLWAVFGAILIMVSGLLIWRSSRSPLT